MTQARTIEKLLRQQAALADFGSFAFRELDLDKILTEAARICATSLETPFAKICRYRAEHRDLLVVAGWGWHADVVGYVVSPADESSTQGRAFVTGQPVIVKDVSRNSSFALPPFYADHGIVATADVLIKSKSGSWGVLEVDSSTRREFDQHDLAFLTGFANVLAEAAATAERTALLRRTIELKDQLLLERQKQAHELHVLQHELLRVTRLNAMGQMTAAIAHELNQPLTAISNYVSAAKRTLLTVPDESAMSRAIQLMEKVAEQTHRAGDIIKNLRQFVEKRESVRKPASLSAIVKRSLALANSGAEEHVDVTMALDDGLPDVMVDGVQIQQVLVNLICNSMEAMENSEKRELLLSTEPGADGFAIVTVRDSGPGLPHEIASNLFQPFVTASGRGLGLGLTICDVLVKANGGRIWLMDDVPEGTGFRFSVPFAPVQPAPEWQAGG